MHETLVYLAHLDHDDTETQMLEKLRIQVWARSACAGEIAHAFICNGRVRSQDAAFYHAVAIWVKPVALNCTWLCR